MLKAKEIMTHKTFLVGPPLLFNPLRKSQSKCANDNANISNFPRIYYTLKTCHLVPLLPSHSEKIRCETAGGAR